MSVHAYLFFTGTCRYAMTRYHQVLGGQLDVMTVVDMLEGAEPPPGPPNPDLVIHAVLALGAGDLIGDQPPCHRACAAAVAHEGEVRVLVAVPGYSVALHYSLGGGAWLAATARRPGHLRGGRLPLDASPITDRVHRGFAVVAYASLALTPIVGGQTLSLVGMAGLRPLPASAECPAPVLAPRYSSRTSLLQRLGLTLGDGRRVLGGPPCSVASWAATRL